MKSAASGFKDSPARLEAGLDDGDDLEGTEGLVEEGDADGDDLKEDDGLEKPVIVGARERQKIQNTN